MAWLRSLIERSSGLTTYAIEWREGGKVRARQLGPVTEKEAEYELAAMEAGKRSRRAAVAVDAKRAVREYLKHLKVSGRRQGTLDHDADKLKPLLDEWGDRPMAGWSRAMLETLLHDRAWSSSRVRQALGVYRRFIAWCRAVGYLCGDFVGEFKPPRARPQEHREALGADQCRRLLDEARGHYLEVPVALALFVGLSRADLRALTWAEVDLDAGLITRPRSKTGRALRLPMSEPLREVVESLALAAWAAMADRGGTAGPVGVAETARRVRRRTRAARAAPVAREEAAAVLEPPLVPVGAVVREEATAARVLGREARAGRAGQDPPREQAGTRLQRKAARAGREAMAVRVTARVARAALAEPAGEAHPEGPVATVGVPSGPPHPSVMAARRGRPRRIRSRPAKRGAGCRTDQNSPEAPVASRRPIRRLTPYRTHNLGRLADAGVPCGASEVARERAAVLLGGPSGGGLHCRAPCLWPRPKY